MIPGKGPGPRSTHMLVLAYTWKHVRDLIWLGDSLERLKTLPAGIRSAFGFGLYRAQAGGTSDDAKRLHGFGMPVWELRASDQRGTYRAVYVIAFRNAVYVLHAFQKKSKSGIATPKRDLELIAARLKLVRRLERDHG